MSDGTRTGRPCSICTSTLQSEVDSQLVTGITVAEVSRRFQLSPDAVRRHRAQHVVVGIDEIKTTTGPATIALRLQEAAEAARLIRQRAAEAGNGAVALRAIDTEARVLVALSERLGISAEATIDVLREGDDILRALAAVIREQPAAAELAASEFELLDRHDLAEEVRIIHQSSTDRRAIAS